MHYMKLTKKINKKLEKKKKLVFVDEDSVQPGLAAIKSQRVTQRFIIYNVD